MAAPIPKEVGASQHGDEEEVEAGLVTAAYSISKDWRCSSSALFSAAIYNSGLDARTNVLKV